MITKTLQINPRDSNGDTLLHLVSSKLNTFRANTSNEIPYSSIFPNVEVIELLLECGASVDVINFNGNCPIHIAATKQNYNSKVIETLLRYGAHIDRRSMVGVLPCKLLSSISECTINTLDFISLKCLAARTIVEMRIPYKSEIPQSLEAFIRIH